MPIVCKWILGDHYRLKIVIFSRELSFFSFLKNVDVWCFMLTLNDICSCVDICWCLITSYTVLCCLDMWGGSQRVSACCLWTRLNAFKGVKECSGLVCSKCSILKSSERRNFTHLTLFFLKDLNTKKSLNKPSKNHWALALFWIFGTIRRKLQFTVSLDNPVSVVITSDSSCSVKKS